MSSSKIYTCDDDTWKDRKDFIAALCERRIDMKNPPCCVFTDAIEHCDLKEIQYYASLDELAPIQYVVGAYKRGKEIGDFVCNYYISQMNRLGWSISENVEDYCRGRNETLNHIKSFELLQPYTKDITISKEKKKKTQEEDK